MTAARSTATTYTPAELRAALDRPVVRRLRELLGLRRDHPAFAGAPTVEDPGSRLRLARRAGSAHAALDADVARGRWSVTASDDPQPV